MPYDETYILMGFMGIVAIIAILLLLLIVNKFNKNNVNNNKNNNNANLHYNYDNNQTNVIYTNKEDEQNINITENMPYRKKLLLTKNEWAFYKSLKPVADELSYTVLAKIRVADLVEVNTKDRSEWQRYFNKINKKHIDFVLAKPENLQIVLLIELDDNSHNEAQKKRDDFIDELYKQTGYKFIRVRGTGNLKEIIKQQINEKQENKESAAIINQQQNCPAPSCLPQSGNMDGTTV